MSKKQQRLALVAGALMVFGAAVALVLTALESTMTYFYSPSELAALETRPEKPIRIGGLVQKDSVETLDGGLVRFGVTDGAAAYKVEFAGLLPDLFREGQGIVATGTLRADDVFEASQVLAKHDENYMPPEVADALKKTGQWQHGKKAADDGTKAKTPADYQGGME
ncbi:MAG: cytochrome c maturation protein CcmE [Alphaproteobacteria bacterium]